MVLPKTGTERKLSPWDATLLLGYFRHFDILIHNALGVFFLRISIRILL